MAVFKSKVNVNSESFKVNRADMLGLIDKLEKLNARAPAISASKKPRFDERKTRFREHFGRSLRQVPAKSFENVVCRRKNDVLGEFFTDSAAGGREMLRKRTLKVPALFPLRPHPDLK